ncbi:hypothetical protein TrVE_jg12493 [Triparma verrucosa]|uniref:Uncharacterized protein n=1 Tax=Triparma verrucosa TaxID=1606542 RepID=A0A9W7F9H9_9STRA|nr:hypothetical protein TrVE_jg12493 [Triparma verrucosa]
MFFLLNCKSGRSHRNREVGAGGEAIMSASTGGGTTFPDRLNTNSAWQGFEDVGPGVGVDVDKGEVEDLFDVVSEDEEVEEDTTVAEVDELDNLVGISFQETAEASFVIKDATRSSDDNNEDETLGSDPLFLTPGGGTVPVYSTRSVSMPTPATATTPETKEEEPSFLPREAFKPSLRESTLVRRVANKEAEKFSRMQRSPAVIAEQQRLRRKANLIQARQSNSQNYDADDDFNTSMSNGSSESSEESYEPSDGGLIRISVERKAMISDRPVNASLFLAPVSYNDGSYVCECKRASCYGCRPVFSGERTNEIQFVPSDSIDDSEYGYADREDETADYVGMDRFHLDDLRLLPRVRKISFADEISKIKMEGGEDEKSATYGLNFDSDRTYLGSSSSEDFKNSFDDVAF